MFKDIQRPYHAMRRISFVSLFAVISLLVVCYVNSVLFFSSEYFTGVSVCMCVIS